MLDIIQFIQGNFMSSLPILAVGLFGVAIILERFRALYLVYPIQNEGGFFDRIRDLVMDGKTAEAVALCERYDSKPVAHVVKKALLRAHQPESLIENGLEIAIEEASQKVQKRTQFLAMIANVATLLGLLGTIGGLINSFKGLAAVDAQQKTALLAQGISEAMNHTMLGLAVAIPCMIMFSFLMNKTNRMMSEVESSAIKVLDFLKQRYFEAEKKDGRGAA